VANPTTTYHLAPALVVLAWPVAARSHRVPGHWRPALVAVAGGVTLAVAAVAALTAQDALAGPALVGPNAGSETRLVILLATAVALWLARPPHGSRTAPVTDDSDGRLQQRGQKPVTVVGTGGGCTTTLGAKDQQCAWSPGPPAP
jgi:hypothetical protein